VPLPVVVSAFDAMGNYSTTTTNLWVVADSALCNQVMGGDQVDVTETEPDTFDDAIDSTSMDILDITDSSDTPGDQMSDIGPPEIKPDSPPELVDIYDMLPDELDTIHDTLTDTLPDLFELIEETTPDISQTCPNVEGSYRITVTCDGVKKVELKVFLTEINCTIWEQYSIVSGAFETSTTLHMICKDFPELMIDDCIGTVTTPDAFSLTCTSGCTADYKSEQ